MNRSKAATVALKLRELERSVNENAVSSLSELSRVAKSTKVGNSLSGVQVKDSVDISDSKSIQAVRNLRALEEAESVEEYTDGLFSEYEDDFENEFERNIASPSVGESSIVVKISVEGGTLQIV